MSFYVPVTGFFFCSHLPHNETLFDAALFAPIQPFEQDGQLPWTQTQGAADDAGPHEMSTLKLLGQHAKTRAIKPEQLDAVCCSSAEDEHTVDRHTAIRRD